ncbi:MAG: Uma2 family endonuclease [Oscillospiraceae bacterium]
MALPERALKKITADEFFQLTEESTERLELIDGEIVALAAPSRTHQNIVARLHYTIFGYITKNKGRCNVMISPFDVVLGDDVVQPDVFVVCNPLILNERCCNGAPDWVIEVVSSNRGDDFTKKLAIYQDAGVREYWIVDPKNQKTLVYFWEKNDFPDIYTFETPIPVEIYNRELSIQISELL